MRCPACGAHNPDGAAWCTQCYARPDGGDRAGGRAEDTGADGADLDGTDVPGSDLGGADVPSSGSGTGEAGTSRLPSAPLADASARDVRTVGGEVEWRCPRCDAWSPLLAATCVTCGGPRTGFGDAPSPPAIAEDRRGALVAASAIVPGLGHVLARRIGTGVARMVLGLGWLLGGLVLARAAASSDASGLPAVPLLLGAGTLWAATVHDTWVLDHGREILRPRVLAGLTVAVVGTLVLAFATTATLGGAGA